MSNFNKKVVIIGGGYSGMLLSIMLSNEISPSLITIIEKNPRIGKKILNTGNGQCNLSNSSISISNYHSHNKERIGQIVDTNLNLEIEKMYNNLGIKLIEDNGKIYPLSKQAQSVLDALRLKIESLGINVYFNEEVVEIIKKDKFIVSTKTKKYNGDIVVLATGGCSSKFLGSDGSGFNIARKLGLKVTDVSPSLVQLKCEINDVKGLEGLKQEGIATLLDANNNLVKSFEGDILFTKLGISGNAIFKLSSYLEGNFKRKISLDLCPTMNNLEIEEFLEKKKRNNPYLKVQDAFSGIVNRKISERVLVFSNQKLNDPIDKLNTKLVAKNIKSYIVNVIDTLGFDNSQVTHGGISLNEINDNLELKKYPNLYVMGEVLDIDGDCGGYNMYFAYNSAKLVLENIIKK